MRIHLGTDHGGFELKEKVKEWLLSEGHDVIDHGAYHFDKDDDYPDFIFPCAVAVAGDSDAIGVIFGGSGQGEAMAANRVKGARAAVYYGSALPIMAVDVSGRESQDPYEIVRLTREHNHANVLSIGVRFVAFDEAKKAILTWVNHPTSTDDRHLRRIKQLDQEM